MRGLRKWRVMTLTRESFPAAVSELQGQVSASGFSPDAVVSIRRGGEFVGKLMFAGVPHYAVTLQRSTTKHKNGLFASLIRYMPRFILDWLRIVEATVGSPSPALPSREGEAPPQPSPQGEGEAPPLPSPQGEGVKLALNLHPDGGFRGASGPTILIVDDAVDSGATLSAVREMVAARCPGADIRTAAITVTTESPLLMPDYYLFHDFTLIRFPWSIDSKTPPIKS